VIGKFWNRTGKIKAAIIILAFAINIFLPIQGQEAIDYFVLLPSFQLAFLTIVVSKLNSKIFGSILEKPSWNDNPISFSKPLGMIQFGSILFLCIGIGSSLSSIVQIKAFSAMGLMLISAGLGGLIGIWLTLKWTKNGGRKNEGRTA